MKYKEMRAGGGDYHVLLLLSARCLLPVLMQAGMYQQAAESEKDSDEKSLSDGFSYRQEATSNIYIYIYIYITQFSLYIYEYIYIYSQCGNKFPTCLL